MSFVCSGEDGAAPLALVGLLDGSLLAVSLARGAAADSGAQPPSPLTVRWRWQGGAPIFGSPAVAQRGRTVVVSAVSGAVAGLDAATGQQRWRVALDEQVYADALALPGEDLVLLATQAGRLHALRAGDGRRAASVAVGGGAGVSAAPAVVLSWRAVGRLAAAAADGGLLAVPDAGAATLVAVCSTGGGVDVLAVTGAVRDGGCQARPVAAAALPGQLFSGPVALGPWLLAGCRDDCLWALRLA